MTKTILITGATDGIGRLTAEKLATEGHTVLLHGRSASKLEAAAKRLSANPSKGCLGINFGKNKETEEAAQDYVAGIKALASFASYLVINVSSPNTPGLRAEQAQERLRPLVKACVQARAEAGASAKPLLVKIAPDMSEADFNSFIEERKLIVPQLALNILKNESK